MENSLSFIIMHEEVYGLGLPHRHAGKKPSLQ